MHGKVKLITGNELPRGKSRGIKSETTTWNYLEAGIGVWTRVARKKPDRPAGLQ